MADVNLTFTAPDAPDLAELHIFESDTPEGLNGWSLIETVEDIGEYPDYITSYLTHEATTTENYFAVQWANADGDLYGDLSNSLQGGTQLLVSEIVERVLLRNPGLDATVVRQETEAAIESLFQLDPYTAVRGDLSPAKLRGVTFLVLAYSMLSDAFSGATATDYTAGLVSQKLSSSSSSSTKDALEFIKIAEGLLGMGIGVSRVVQGRPLPRTAGIARVVGSDITRLMLVEAL